MSETIPVTQPRLLDQLCRCIRDKHYTLSTGRTYVYCAKWYIRFHGLRHPADMGPSEIRTFLSYLNNDRHIAGSAYSQSLCALLFLYKEVLGIELPWIEGISRPTRPPKRPTVLTQAEVFMKVSASSVSIPSATVPATDESSTQALHDSPLPDVLGSSFPKQVDIALCYTRAQLYRETAPVRCQLIRNFRELLTLFLRPGRQ